MRLTSAALLLLTASSSNALSIGATRPQAIQCPAGSSDCPEGITQDPGVATDTSLVGVPTASSPPSNPTVTPSVLPDPFPILLDDDPLSILLSFDTPPSTTPSLGDLYSILFPPQPSGPVSLPGPLNLPSGMPTALEPRYIGKRDNSMCCMPTIVEPTSIGKRDNSMCCMPTPLEPTSIGKRDNSMCCMTTPLEPTSIGKRDNPLCCMPTPLEPTDIGTSVSPSQSGNPPSSKPTAPAPTSSDTSVSQSQSGAAGGSEKPGSAKGLSVPLVTLLGAVGLGMLL